MDEIDVEVAAYIKERGEDYTNFQTDVLQDLYRFKDRSSLSQSIYRIYSRADKQVGGRVLKSLEGMASTIRRWRDQGGSGKVYELHDIIGVTIVTYFDSEVPRVVEALKKTGTFKEFFRSFEFADTWERPSKEERENKKFVGGYYAKHVKVASAHDTAVNSMLCEIQVKSLLNDGWAAKIHDLVYKSKSKIDPEVRRQADIIGGMVNGLEQMSDGLRTLVTRNQQIEEERRAAAIFVLMKKTLDAMAQDGTEDERDWYQRLDSDIGHFRSCEDNDAKLGQLMALWRTMFAAKPRTQIGCRLLLLLALVRRSKNTATSAFSAIDEWASSFGKPIGKVKAMRFRSTSHWMLGQYDQAIETCRDLLEPGQAEGLYRAMTKIDLAYYLAERSFIRDGSCSAEIINEIQTLTADWERDGWDDPIVKEGDEVRLLKSRQDSIGAIQIMTAETADGVFAGHQLCSDAKEWSAANLRDEDLFDDFYKLHTERARRRIQELPPL
jgi:ppGpp synthetase/RelA/SpoT-type nucleotidyltranferase